MAAHYGTWLDRNCCVYQPAPREAHKAQAKTILGAPIQLHSLREYPERARVLLNVDVAMSGRQLDWTRRNITKDRRKGGL